MGQMCVTSGRAIYVSAYIKHGLMNRNRGICAACLGILPAFTPCSVPVEERITLGAMAANVFFKVTKYVCDDVECIVAGLYC